MFLRRYSWFRFGGLVSLYAAALAFCLSTGILYAETVFLKNGTLVEGQVSETGRGASVITADGTKQDILAAKILRVVYTDHYKTKTFLHRPDGTRSWLYITGEDRDSYYVRNELTSPEEIKIPKKEIKFIAKDDIEMCQSLNESEYERYNESWDTWYLTFYPGFPFNNGFPLSNGGVDFSFELSRSFSIPFYYSISMGMRTIHYAAAGADYWISSKPFGKLSAGYSIELHERFAVILYAGAGASRFDDEKIEGGDRTDLNSDNTGFAAIRYSVTAGVRLPVRYRGHDCIVPFLEYLYMTKSGFSKIFIAGVGYAF